MVTVRELARSQGFPDHFVFYAADGDVKTVGRSSILITAKFSHLPYAASSTDRQCGAMAYWSCPRPSGSGGRLCDMERRQARRPHHRGRRRRLTIYPHISHYICSNISCTSSQWTLQPTYHVLFGSFHQAPPQTQRCAACRVQARHLTEPVRVLGSPTFTSDLPSQHTQRELWAG